MAGEFGELVWILINFITWLLDMSTYVVSFMFLLLACLVPWRFPIILLTGLSEMEDYDDIRWFCVAMFGISLLDAIAVPLGVLAACVPSCTAAVVYGTCTSGWRAVLFVNKDAGCSLRYLWIVMCVIAIQDCVGMPLALLLACAVPTRLPFWCCMVPKLCMHGVSKFDAGTQDNVVVGYSCDIRGKLLYNILLCIVDAFAFLSAAILCMLPLRVYVAGIDVCRAFRKPDADSEDLSKYGFNWQIRSSLIGHACGLIADMLFLPFGVISAMVPTRTWYFGDLCNQLYCRRSCVDREQDFHDEGGRCERECAVRTNMLVNMVFALFDVFSGFCGLIAFGFVIRACQTWKDVKEAMGTKSDVGASDFRQTYNEEVRFALITNGITMLLDFIFFPLLLLLGITMWRAKPVVDSIRQGLNWTTRKLIVQQSAVLALDIICLPLLLIVMVTWYRSGPVRRFFGCDRSRDEELEAKDPKCGYHESLLECVVFLLCDLLILPLLLVLGVFVYRLRYVHRAFIHEQGFDFHCKVCEQFVSQCVDVPFLIIGLIVCITMVRADRMCVMLRGQLRDACGRRKETIEAFGMLCLDVLSIFPVLLVFLTLYRLPLMVGRWMSMWSPPLRGAPRLELLDVSIKTPKPSGPLTLRAHVAKPPDVHDLRYIQVRVMSPHFWRHARACVGRMATFAEIMFPLSIYEKNAELSKFVRGENDAIFDIGYSWAIDFEAVRKTLISLSGGPPMCVQVEAKCASGETILMLSLGIPMRALEEWLEQAEQAKEDLGEAPFVPMNVANFVTEGEEVDRIRGEHRRLKDAWHAPAWMQLGLVCYDAAWLLWCGLHMLLWLLTLIGPVRFWECCRFATEPNATRFRRYTEIETGALAQWEKRCREVSMTIDEVGVKFAKSKAATAFARSNLARSGKAYSEVDRAIHCMECIIGCCCCIWCPCCPNYFELREAYCNDDDLDDPTTQAGHPMWQKNKALGDLGQFLKSARLDEASAFLEECRAQTEEVARDVAKDGEGSLRGGYAVIAQSTLRCSKLWSEALWWQLAIPRLQEGYADRWAQRRGGYGGFNRSRVLNWDGVADPEQEKHEARCLVATTTWLRGQASTCFERLAERRQGVSARLAAMEAHAERVGGAQRRRLRADWKTVVRYEFFQMLTDYLALPLLLLLLITVYRIPATCADVKNADSKLEKKKAVLRQVYMIGWDFLQVLLLVFLSALLVVTVVKLPDFLYGLNPYKGVRKLNRWAMHNICELVMGIMELLLFVTFCKTYRLLLSSAAFSLFSPATVLAYAMPKRFSPQCRFILSCAFIVVWFGVFLAVREYRLHVACGAAVSFIICFCGLAINDVPGWTGPREFDWWPPTARLTPLNNLALLIIAVEAIAVGMFTVAGYGNELPPGFSDFLEAVENRVGYRVIGYTVSFITVGISAVPLIASDDDERGHVTTHPQWVFGNMVLMELLLLPVASALYPEVVPVTNDGPWFQSLLMFYYLFVVLLAPASWDAPLKSAANYDIRTVGWYRAGHHLLLLLACTGGFRLWAEGVTIISGLDLVWTVLFITRGCSVVWVQVLRIGIGGGGVAAGLSGSLMAAIVVWGACVLAAVVVGVATHCSIRRDRLDVADVPALLISIRALLTRLALWGDEMSDRLRLGGNFTGHDAAFLLLEVEARLPIERLQREFVEDRAVWRQNLWAKANDFGVVLRKAKQLEAAFYAPPSTTQLKRLLSRVGKGRGIPPWIAQEVLEFVGTAQDERLDIAKPPDVCRGFVDSSTLRDLWSRSEDQIQYHALAAKHPRKRPMEEAPGQDRALAAPPHARPAGFDVVDVAPAEPLASSDSKPDLQLQLEATLRPASPPAEFADEPLRPRAAFGASEDGLPFQSDLP